MNVSGDTISTATGARLQVERRRVFVILDSHRAPRLDGFAVEAISGTGDCAAGRRALHDSFARGSANTGRAGGGHQPGFALGGPIGAGIGALAGAIAGIWASHAARAAGAKSENAALNSAVQAFDASLKAVFAAANSGQVTGAQAAQACQTILQNYWQGMVPYMVGPGRSDCSKQGMNCSCSPSNCGTKTCTAGCCAGCFDIMPSISSAVAALSSPTGGTAQISEVYPSKYGTTMRSAYQLTYTPPSAASVAGVANSLSSSVAGIPLWLIAAAGLGLYVAMQ